LVNKNRLLRPQCRVGTIQQAYAGSW
jgi:hypothetical protein